MLRFNCSCKIAKLCKVRFIKSIHAFLIFLQPLSWSFKIELCFISWKLRFPVLFVWLEGLDWWCAEYVVSWWFPAKFCSDYWTCRLTLRSRRRPYFIYLSLFFFRLEVFEERGTVLETLPFLLLSGAQTFRSLFDGLAAAIVVSVDFVNNMVQVGAWLRFLKAIAVVCRRLRLHQSTAFLSGPALHNPATSLRRRIFLPCLDNIGWLNVYRG